MTETIRIKPCFKCNDQEYNLTVENFYYDKTRFVKFGQITCGSCGYVHQCTPIDVTELPQI